MVVMKTLLVLFGLSACTTDGSGTITSDDPAGDSPDANGTAAPAGARDPSGYGDTVFANGPDPGNPFFASLGTNGRTCATCHDQASGWSITPAMLQARFAANPADPIFALVDGAVSPRADVSTLAAQTSS